MNEIKERPPFWENQSSQLPKVNSNFEFKRDNNTPEFDRYFSNAKLRNGDLDELQSTALIKQNRKPVADSSSSLLRQLMHSSAEQRPEKSAQPPRGKQASESNAANDKGLDLLQSLTQSANLSSNLSNLTQSKSNAKSPTAYPKSPSDTASNGCLKEENSCLFNRQLQDNDDQQMSPSSSSSTSAYVSLYASSSFSSAGSSSSNYSTSGFNSNNSNNSNNENAKEPNSSSDSSSKKISRSAILDSLINRKHNNKLLDKPFDKSLLKAAPAEPPPKADGTQESKANKIVIDVSMNESNNYDSLNQSIQNEHIYEELEGCRFEKEINIIDNLNSNLNSVKKSIFEGASKDQIIEYLMDAKESE